MASTTRSKKRAPARAGLAVLSLREVADLLRCPVDHLVDRPGLLPLVIDLSGKRKPAKRLQEDDYDELLIRTGDLEAWLEGLRYGAVPAGVAA